MEPVFIAITMDSGEPLRILQFVTRGRGDSLPFGARWVGVGQREREATPSNIIREVDKSCSAGIARPVSFRVVSRADVPTERTYREAWRDDGRSLGHDMAKAREIHRGHLRVLRVPLLEALDVEYQRADEQLSNAEEKRRIAAAKQVLRDLPADPAIDAATSVQELLLHLNSVR